MSPDTGEFVDDGWAALYAARDLWSLLDRARAAVLQRGLKDRWELENERGDRIIPLRDLPALVALLRDLRPALRTITTPELTVLPEYAEVVRALFLPWFMHWREDERDVDTLSLTAHKIEQAAEFLEKAQKRGSDVELD
jgi:hypothetical protein